MLKVVAVLAGIFGIAVLSSFLGLLWNHDILYLLNLGVLVWATAGTSVPGRPRLRRMVMILNLFALTMVAGRTEGQGVSYGVQNWLGLRDSWLSAALLVANYLAHVWIGILAYRATPREDRRPIRSLLATSAMVPLLGLLWLSFAGDYPIAHLNQRYSASPTLVYEKWQIDFGGTGGLDCRVYRIRTLGLVARYQQIDPDRDRSPIPDGCGY